MRPLGEVYSWVGAQLGSFAGQDAFLYRGNNPLFPLLYQLRDQAHRSPTLYPFHLKQQFP